MFNLEQLEELEKVFAKQHNLVGEKRAQLAARLKLTENQVGMGTLAGPELHWGGPCARLRWGQWETWTLLL